MVSAESLEQQSCRRENTSRLLLESVSHQALRLLPTRGLNSPLEFSLRLASSQAHRKLWLPNASSWLAQRAMELAMATSSIDAEEERFVLMLPYDNCCTAIKALANMDTAEGFVH